jgi:hypothetical protein
VEHEWRCLRCDALLGVRRGTRLHLRYKEAQYIVDGADYVVTAVCRSCFTVNERSETKESVQPIRA